MKRILFRSVLVLGLGVMSLCGASQLAAKQHSTQPLPTVEAILDKEAQAMGGKDANSKVKTFIMRATLTVEGVDIQTVLHYAGPTKQRMEISVDGMGSEVTVINGDIAWVKSDFTGDRILQDEERTEAFAKAEANSKIFQRIGNWRTLYKEFILLGEVQLDGKAAYKVKLTTQKGKVLIDYYDKTTGLLVRCETDMETPEGTLSLVLTFSDFRQVDGVTHAFTTTIVGGEADIVLTIDSMEQNVAIPESLFVLPLELKTEGGM